MPQLQESMPSTDQAGERLRLESVALPNLTYIAQFEDVVAAQVYPNMPPECQARWGLRTPLRKHVQPRGFNGSVSNIVLTPMGQPVDMLRSASDRGVAFRQAAGAPHLKEKLSQEELKHFFGFVLTADARSSGRGVISTLQAELYLYPRPFKVVDGRRVFHNNPDHAVLRALTIPELSVPGSIGEGLLASRALALQILRDNLSRPILTPMGQ